MRLPKMVRNSLKRRLECIAWMTALWDLHEPISARNSRRLQFFQHKLLIYQLVHNSKKREPWHSETLFYNKTYNLAETCTQKDWKSCAPVSMKLKEMNILGIPNWTKTKGLSPAVLAPQPKVLLTHIMDFTTWRTWPPPRQGQNHTGLSIVLLFCSISMVPVKRIQHKLNYMHSEKYLGRS